MALVQRGREMPGDIKGEQGQPLISNQKGAFDQCDVYFSMGVLGLEARSWAFALRASEVHKNAISVPVSGLERERWGGDRPKPCSERLELDLE